MKKWITILLASLLVFSLSACNTSSDDSATTSSDKSDELSLREIYGKALERQNEIKSLSTDISMDMKMTMEYGGEKFDMTSKSDIKADMTLEPVTMYMTGNMLTVDPTTNEKIDMDLKIYMNNDGMYMFDSTTNAWYKMPADNLDAVLGQTAAQVNVQEQLKELEPLIDDFKIEEKDDSYILTLNVASEKLTDYILD